MRQKGLQILVFHRNYSCPRTPFLEPVPVFPEHVIGDAVHRYVIVRTELVYGIMDSQLRIVAQRPAHVGPECLLEASGDMAGYRPLSLIIKIVSEQRVDHHVPACVQVIAAGLAHPVESYPDIVLPLVGRYRSVLPRYQVEMKLDQPPQQGAPLGPYGVTPAVDAQDILPERPADPYVHGHYVFLLSHCREYICPRGDAAGLLRMH